MIDADPQAEPGANGGAPPEDAWREVAGLAADLCEGDGYKSVVVAMQALAALIVAAKGDVRDATKRGIILASLSHDMASLFDHFSGPSEEGGDD